MGPHASAHPMGPDETVTWYGPRAWAGQLRPWLRPWPQPRLLGWMAVTLALRTVESVRGMAGSCATIAVSPRANVGVVYTVVHPARVCCEKTRNLQSHWPPSRARPLPHAYTAHLALVRKPATRSFGRCADLLSQQRLGTHHFCSRGRSCQCESWVRPTRPRLPLGRRALKRGKGSEQG